MPNEISLTISYVSLFEKGPLKIEDGFNRCNYFKFLNIFSSIINENYTIKILTTA
jgi:hypothetical protein